MTGPDWRVAAWVSAHDCLSQATKVVVKKGRIVDDESVWRWHWSLLTQAHQWALLAQAPMEVGLAAGTVLKQRFDAELRRHT